MFMSCVKPRSVYEADTKTVYTTVAQMIVSLLGLDYHEDTGQGRGTYVNERLLQTSLPDGLISLCTFSVQLLREEASLLGLIGQCSH